MKIRDEIENIEKIDRRKIELMLNREISSNYYNLKKNRNNKDYMELKEIEKLNNKQKKRRKKRNGKGKEYDGGILRFEGEYLNGNKWNGKGYDINNNIIFFSFSISFSI